MSTLYSCIDKSSQTFSLRDLPDAVFIYKYLESASSLKAKKKKAQTNRKIYKQNFLRLLGFLFYVSLSSTDNLKFFHSQDQLGIGGKRVGERFLDF